MSLSVLFDRLERDRRVQSIQEHFLSDELNHNWFTGVVVMTPDAKVLWFRYRDIAALEEWKREPVKKFPGGKGKWNDGSHRYDHTPAETVVNELAEEVFVLDAPRDLVRRMVPFSYHIPPQRPGNIDRTPHHKFFVLVELREEFEEFLRKKEKDEGEEQKEDGTTSHEILGAPRFSTLGALGNGLFGSHRAAAYELRHLLQRHGDVVKTLGQKDEGFGYLVQDLELA